MRRAHGKKLRILITAGPTREYLDPVRYLSNDSSGQMGFALAKAAAEFGLEATLVAGPVSLPTPKRVKRIDVVSALEMRKAVITLAKKADIVIMAAAVADWRPARFAKQKIKRRRAGAQARRRRFIALKQNPDILAELGKKKRPDQLIVGFALETEALEKNAREKLARKNCDWNVANSAAAIGAKSSSAFLMSKEGKRISLPRLPKEDLAAVILSHILSQH